MILASGSPQRRAILEQLGVAFEVVVTGVERADRRGSRRRSPLENARRKAQPVLLHSRNVRPRWPAGQQQAVLGVDTIVALDGRDLRQAG